MSTRIDLQRENSNKINKIKANSDQRRMNEISIELNEKFIRTDPVENNTRIKCNNRLDTNAINIRDDSMLVFYFSYRNPAAYK